MEDEEAKERRLLIKYGYNPDLPARGVAGGPGEPWPGLRNHVCYLEGTEIDGHADPDLSGACIYCHADLP